MAIGDGAELFATGMLGVRSDDNIFLSKNKTDDVIFDINPGLELTFGKNAQMNGGLTLVESFANYSDNSKLNTNLFSGNFFSKYDDGKMKLGFNLGYNELSQNTPDIRGLTRRDVFTAGGNGEIEVSQITSAGAGISYTKEKFHAAAHNRGYGDSETLQIPLNFYYKWTPKVDLSAGYQFRDYQTDVGLDSTDHFFNVGARGEFTPKLVGKVAVGYTDRHLSRGSDKSLPGLDASLTYEISPKTNLQVGASNDFGTSPQGAQQKNFTLNGMVTTKLTEEWTINAGLSYRATTYLKTATDAERTDDYFEGTLGASYILSTNIRFVGAYVYRNYSSNIASSEFNNNVFSIAANFRY